MGYTWEYVVACVMSLVRDPSMRVCLCVCVYVIYLDICRCMYDVTHVCLIHVSRDSFVTV